MLKPSILIVLFLYFFSDHVFGSDKTTLDVYNSVALPIINAAMLGFNGMLSSGLLSFKPC